MRIVDYHPTDYPIIASWWRHRLPQLPDFSVLLPSTGWMAIDDHGEPQAAAWLYREADGVICWLAWMVTRPGLTPRRARRALDALSDYAVRQAAAGGYHLMYALGRNGLGRFFAHHGFALGDCRVDQYVKHLPGGF